MSWHTPWHTHCLRNPHTRAHHSASPLTARRYTNILFLGRPGSGQPASYNRVSSHLLAALLLPLLKQPMLTCDAEKCTGRAVRRPQAGGFDAHHTRRAEPSTRQLSFCTPFASFNRFPFNGFTCSFTLFSKCFSSFPHGTCSLSVSCQYLALGEIYHPFWAAFSNNPTRRKCLVLQRCVQPKTGFSPSLTFFSKKLRPVSITECTSLNYNSALTPISNLSFSRFTRRY